MTHIPSNIQSDPAAETLPTYDARQLVSGGDVARIALEDKLYTLRITRAGKLILTK
ncbi:hemin uptake protein HemP [Roseovarius nanhaiticus]|uniref:hemin uptake protein HemP n=1 Tax=Roseovarius nanhaiticus TaxID=573024 RepID=UPI0024938030|nr:hemin uptake protein HemP [Roseovarius nanhaiticus]